MFLWSSATKLAGSVCLAVAGLVAAGAMQAAAKATIEAAPRIASLSEPGCQEVVASFENNEGRLAELIDPQLASQADIAAARQKYSELHDCLAQLGDELSDEQRMLQQLSEYFLIFTAREADLQDGSRLELVDLTTSSDPAIVRMREQADLPAPQGYIFVRYYPSRQAMPGLVRRPFENPEVAGATFFTRYIAVLDEERSNWADTLLHARVLPVTISHELVHAYINASLGAYHFTAMPTWYHEGLATYFSDSDETHTVVTTSYTVSQGASEEYQTYALIFAFLQSRLGEDDLNERIRASIEQVATAPLYASLDIPDDRWLESAAREWQTKRERTIYLIALAISALATFGLFSLAPEYECECGHTGHRRDFPGDACPECGRRLAVSGRVRRRIPLRLADTCQVCGRRYWFWQFGQLHIHKWQVKAWKPPEQAPDSTAPYVWVHRICTNCSHLSQTALQAYTVQMQNEIRAARERSEPLYQAWLAAAPVRQYDSFSRLQSFATPAAVEMLIQAAVYAAYPEWIDPPPAVQFAHPDHYDYTQSPPQDYHAALLRQASSPDQAQPLNLTGSVSRMSDEIVFVEWQPASAVTAPSLAATG